MSSWDSGLNYSQCQVRIVKGLKPGEGGWNFLKFAMTAKRDDRSSLAIIAGAQKCEMRLMILRSPSSSVLLPSIQSRLH
eukprot:scaffold22661_cov200-Cylindrotheca_fusiformis.AAC.5